MSGVTGQVGVTPLDAPVEGGPDLYVAASELLAAMGLIRRVARFAAARPEILSALTGAQLELVRLVRRRPAVSVAEAAEELRLAPNTVSTLVGQLTEAAIVVRVTDPADRRVARLDLEPAVRRKVSDWHDRRTDAVAAVMADLSPRDRDALVKAVPVLMRIATSLEDLGGERCLQATR